MKNNKFLVLEKAIQKFYDNKDNDKLNKIVQQFHPLETYNCIKDWKFNEYVDFIQFLNKKNSANIFKEFPLEEQSKILEVLPIENKRIILNEIYVDEIVDIFEFISPDAAEEILNIVDIETKRKLDKIFVYNKTQVGYNMVVDYIFVKDEWSLKKTRTEIKNKVNEEELDITENIFVIDENQKFLGYIKIATIFFKPDNNKISQYIKQVPALKTTDNISDAEEIISKYDLSSVPVVDSANKLVGIVDFEEVVKRFEEVEESFLEASNVKNTDINYSDLKINQLYKSRVSWVIVLLFVGTLTQIIITGFLLIWANNGVYNFQENTAIPGIISLALTTSLAVSSSVNDTAGNSGSQVSATVIRAIAVGEIGEEEYGRAIRKELKVSLLIGLTAALASFFRLFIVWGIMGFLDKETISNNAVGDHTNLWVWSWYVVIALIASTTFFISVMIGAMLGVILPIFAVKHKADGAVISGPVQTTVVDIFTFLIYLSLTTAIFIPLLNSGYFGTVDSANQEVLQKFMLIKDHLI